MKRFKRAFSISIASWNPYMMRYNINLSTSLLRCRRYPGHNIHKHILCKQQCMLGQIIQDKTACRIDRKDGRIMKRIGNIPGCGFRTVGGCCEWPSMCHISVSPPLSPEIHPQLPTLYPGNVGTLNTSPICSAFCSCKYWVLLSLHSISQSPCLCLLLHRVRQMLSLRLVRASSRSLWETYRTSRAILWVDTPTKKKHWFGAYLILTNYLADKFLCIFTQNLFCGRCA